MVEEKRSFKKLAIFFRVSRRGRRGGGGGALYAILYGTVLLEHHHTYICTYDNQMFETLQK